MTFLKKVLAVQKIVLSLYCNNRNNMKNIITINEGTLSGDVFYGSFNTTINGKRMTVQVTNHLKDTKAQYEFRIAGKCRAGFITIHETKGTPKNVISGYKKNSLVNIQVKNEYGHWMDVFTTKGNKWYGIDKGFLEVLTVGDMRCSHPTMCDHKIWDFFGAKTWACKAFTMNENESVLA